MIVIGKYEYNDEEEIIESFKELLKPKYSPNFSDYSQGDAIEFAAIME